MKKGTRMAELTSMELEALPKVETRRRLGMEPIMEMLLKMREYLVDCAFPSSSEV
jgi:hypothetical protein